MSYFINFPKLVYSTSLGTKNFKIVPNILAKVTFLREIIQNTDLYYHYSVKEGEKPEDVAFKFYNDSFKHWIILLANQVVDPQYDWPIPQRSLDQYINKKYSSYTLHLNQSELYSAADFEIGEVAYQGSSIDKSSSDSTVESYDSVNAILVVRNPSDVIANNSTICGANTGISHNIIGVTSNDDGLIWSKSAISHYEMTETRWNSYDEIKTVNKYRVSVEDFNNTNNTIIPDREQSTSESYELVDNTTLHIEQNISPVYYYDYEIELNEAKRNVIVPKPTYISRIEQEFKALMI